MYLTVLIAVVTLLMTGCDQVANVGNNNVRPEGEMMHEVMSFDAFNGINIDGVFDVVYRQSDEHRLELEMQESLFEITEIDVVNGILQVNQNQRGLSFQGEDEIPRLYIYAPYLTEVTLDGVITARNWDAIYVDDFTLHIDGVTTLTMSGRAETASFNIDGVSSVDALDFETTSAMIDIDGVSDVSISVESYLDVSIEGISTVEYRGNPTITERYVDMLSTLRQIN